MLGSVRIFQLSCPVQRAAVFVKINKLHQRPVIGLQRLFSAGGSDPPSKPPTFPPPSRPQRQSYDPPLSSTSSHRPSTSNVPGQPPSGPPPSYDPALLEALGISHTPPAKIKQILEEEGVTIEEVKMMVDVGLHKVRDTGYFSDGAPQSRNPQEADEWDPSMIDQINPKRKFFPGQQYDPEDLSPNTKWSKPRGIPKKECPLGGKRGPKIDFANVALLSRFLTDSGRIIGRRKSRVCAKKQRELTRAIKRARMMNMLPYLHKLPEFVRKDNANPIAGDF